MKTTTHTGSQTPHSRSALRRTLVGSLLSVAGAVSMSAHAEVDSDNFGSQDSKYFSGSICGATRHADLNISKNGQAYNTSTTTTLDITCPMLRDMTNTNNMGMNMWVYKASSTSMTCYFNARKLIEQHSFCKLPVS